MSRESTKTQALWEGPSVMNTLQDDWRKCSTCKKPIRFLQKYWVCSVSTCTRARTGLVFCSVSCFDAHVPMMNHRDSGAFEKTAPSKAQWGQTLQNDASKPSSGPSPSRALTQSQPGSDQAPLRSTASTHTSEEVLIVVSKVKEYIKQQTLGFTTGGMNASSTITSPLSQALRQYADQAIKRAQQDGRKTVMERDFD